MNYIDLRTIEEGKYIKKTGATVRKTAEKFGVSKSTVHKDITEHLKKLDSMLYYDVESVLKRNLEERHIRGGLATKKKYLHEN